MKGMGRVGRIVAHNRVLVLGCIAWFALPALADSDPNACRGVDFDMKRPLAASRISVRDVVPAQGMIAFAENGSVPFDQAEEGQCLVRMQRVGASLLVEDNMQCGGSMVTFTGLYRRE